MIESWNQAKIHEELLQKGIQWYFNPPGASHHGGAWERMIRSTRKILGSLVKEQTLDDESLQTLICEAESIINGRPLTAISDDPKDLEPLTPNHLLLLRQEASLPPVSSKEVSCIQGEGGCKFNIWLMSSGIDGKGSTFRFCRNAKGGYAQEEISQ